jgi:hypothetical protein
MVRIICALTGESLACPQVTNFPTIEASLTNYSVFVSSRDAQRVNKNNFNTYSKDVLYALPALEHLPEIRKRFHHNVVEQLQYQPLKEQ